MKIPLFKIHWDDSDVEAVAMVIRRGMHWAIGPEIARFEGQVSQFVGTEYAVAVNSGTSALHVVLKAHGIGKGDEVIVPSLTFIATSNAVLFVGAKPVFADIEDVTLGLDPGSVERAITSRTRAIIAVHVGGIPCRVQELRSLADKHGFLLIEDAAQAMGATRDGKQVCNFGHSAILSFCASKIIPTGEGGMVLTNHRDVLEQALLIRNHGRAETANYFDTGEVQEYVALGYNFRMPSMVAALGISQMQKINFLIGQRRRVARLYLDRMVGIPVKLMPWEGNAWQMFIIRLDDRSALQAHLASKGIQTKVHFYPPIHQTAFYKHEVSLPVTEQVSREALSLPIYPDMGDEEAGYVADSVRRFFR